MLFFPRSLSYNRKYMGQRYIEVFMAHQSDFEEVYGYNSYEGSDCCIRLVGLPYSCIKDDVNRFFHGLKIQQNGITLLYRRDGKCLGDGFVEFCSSEHATKALNNHHQKIGQRFIEVYRCTRAEINMAINSSRCDISLSHTSKTINHYNNKFRTNGYNTSPHRDILQSNRNYYDDIQSRFCEEYYIHVRGIPFDIGDHGLQDIFQSFNPYCISQRCRDDGSFNGEVDVYFIHKAACLDCLHNMNTKIGNYYLEVFSRIRRIKMFNSIYFPTKDLGYVPTHPEHGNMNCFDYITHIHDDYGSGFDFKHHSREPSYDRSHSLYPHPYQNRRSTFEY